MRFNPPPNWPPPPPGWQPDPTWRPDPWWPPPPPGWPLWVPESRGPQHKGVILAIAIGVLAAVGLTIALVATTSDSSSSRTASAITCQADDSEERAVCDAIRRRFAAFIDGDRDRVRALTCRSSLDVSNETFELTESLGPIYESFRDGSAQVTVSDIEVDDTRAAVVLDIELPLPNGSDKDKTISVGSVDGLYVKEGGRWKACGLSPTE